MENKKTPHQLCEIWGQFYLKHQVYSHAVWNKLLFSDYSLFNFWNLCHFRFYEKINLFSMFKMITFLWYLLLIFSCLLFLDIVVVTLCYIEHHLEGNYNDVFFVQVQQMSQSYLLLLFWIILCFMLLFFYGNAILLILEQLADRFS